MRRSSRKLAFLIMGAFILGIAVERLHPHSRVAQKSDPKTPKPIIKVLTLGGSVARGWRDTGWKNWRKGWYGGYLVRGFSTFSKENAANYQIDNHTIVGANSSQMNTLYKGEYQKWLRQDNPQIVAISWGLLNDALPKTPLNTFTNNLRQEINEGLQAHAVVMIITPPVTEASLTTYKTAFKKYLNAELSVAHSYHQQHVYALDIYDTMLSDLNRRHVLLSTLTANSWHPNAKGHELAGAILASELKQQFGSSAVKY